MCAVDLPTCRHTQACLPSLTLPCLPCCPCPQNGLQQQVATSSDTLQSTGDGGPARGTLTLADLHPKPACLLNSDDTPSSTSCSHQPAHSDETTCSGLLSRRTNAATAARPASAGLVHTVRCSYPAPEASGRNHAGPCPGSPYHEQQPPPGDADFAKSQYRHFLGSLQQCDASWDCRRAPRQMHLQLHLLEQQLPHGGQRYAGDSSNTSPAPSATLSRSAVHHDQDSGCGTPPCTVLKMSSDMHLVKKEQRDPPYHHQQPDADTSTSPGSALQLHLSGTSLSSLTGKTCVLVDIS